MHFSIPDTQDVSEGNSTYTLYRRELTSTVIGMNFVSVFCDGATDVAIKEQELMFMRSVHKGIITVRFLAIAHTPQPPVQSIYAEVVQALRDTGMPDEARKHKLVGFAADGAAVMQVFNLHINGVYHCSLRYRQLHSFHEQLKKEYGVPSLPTFPPKKLLSLTAIQLEERRLLLERYIQIISQNQQIAASDTFNGFLLNAQQSSQQEEPEDVTLDVYLMNGHKITVNILSTDQTDDVLESVASQVQLADDFVYYFGLFLIKKEDGSDNAIVRKLQEFESPFISLKAANQNAVYRIVLRKSYWDPMFDDDLLEDRIAMNLIYVQAVSDIERGWVSASKDQHRQLTALQQRGSKKEYLRLARTLKYYGFLQFKPCTVDIPTAGCRVQVAAGNRDFSFSIQTGADEPMDRSFKVTRMRCWRITTTMPEVNGEPVSSAAPTKLELAFEYLVAKDTLKWITVSSDQAILMSMCLQGMVDELIMKKQNRRIKRPSDRNRGSNGSKARSPIAHSLTSSSLKSPSSPTEEKSGALKGNPTKNTNSTGLTENDAFEGIGDDDL